jgi:glycosyltransferase involved in cell wall biosynthesis
MLAQEQPAGGFEVIVADGMSNDGTRNILLKLAEQDPRLRIIDNPDLIVSTGLNAAIRGARGRVIARMDAHTQYAPDYVRRCVEVLEETGADNVGGPWVAQGSGKIGAAIAAAFQSPFATGGGRAHDLHYSGPVDTVYLGCWHRALFDRIGLFDEELVRNQDDEFNLRLVRSGGKVWQSVKIKSIYAPRESLRQLFTQYAQYGYWKARILHKYRLPASVRHLVPASFVLALLSLPALSLLWTTAIWLWMALLGFYAIVNIALSALTAGSKGWNLFFVLPAVFATFHLAYGWGFLRGFTDFIIFKRKPAPSYGTLTRSSHEKIIC